MSHIEITFKTDNAAFDGNKNHEITSILHKLAANITQYGLEDRQPLRDMDGNTVGYIYVFED